MAESSMAQQMSELQGELVTVMILYEIGIRGVWAMRRTEEPWMPGATDVERAACTVLLRIIDWSRSGQGDGPGISLPELGKWVEEAVDDLRRG